SGEDEGRLVGGDACGGQVEMLGGRAAAGGRQQALSTQAASRGGGPLDLVILLGRPGGVLFEHRNLIEGQRLSEDGGHFWLGGGGDPADDRHPGAQVGKKLGLFDADVAAADNNHGLGQLGQCHG